MRARGPAPAVLHPGGDPRHQGALHSGGRPAGFCPSALLSDDQPPGRTDSGAVSSGGIFAILTMWGIRIGLTWIYIGMFGRDLKMVWFFMIMDNISRCILLWSLYRRRKRSLLLFDEY